MSSSHFEIKYLTIVPTTQTYYKKNGLSLKLYIDRMHRCIRIKGFLKADSNIDYALISLDDGQQDFKYDITKLTNEKFDIELLELYATLGLTIDPNNCVYDVKIELVYY